MAVCQLPKLVTRVRSPLAALWTDLVETEKIMMRLGFMMIMLIFFAGCATAPYPRGDLGRISAPGIYHEVARGETLWGISKIYAVALSKIASANRLPDASKIEVGQLIFIPTAGETAKPASYAKAAKLESFIWPVRGIVVSYFGSTKSMAKNKGIDIRAQEGSAVAASRSGRVTFATNHLKGYGKTIIIDHFDGFETVYAHNKENLVQAGQHVKRGEIIAKAGSTGRTEVSALHFEIRKNHKPQNPFYYLP